MEGSIYTSTQICMACGFPRGSSVSCPVTQRHHGTDELITSGRPRTNHHRVVPKNIFKRMQVKLPVLVIHTPGKLIRVRNKHNTQTVREVHPLAPGEEGATADRTGGRSCEVDPSRAGGVGDPVSPKSRVADRKSGDSAQQHSGIDMGETGDTVNENASQEGGEVQYYCYTDENGDTYWCTQELPDSMQPSQSDASAEVGDTSAQGCTAYYEALARQYEADGSVPEGSCICEYVDKDGQTVYYLYTPEVNNTQDNAAATPPQAPDTNDDSTASALAIAVAESKVVSAKESDPTTSSTRKPPHAFLSAITKAFKPRRSSRTRDRNNDLAAQCGGDVDSDFFTADWYAEPPAPLGTVTSESPITSGPSEVSTYDNDVEEFMELLDDGEKKKFLKERKRLIKELAASEKKERESIMKQRSDGVEALRRLK
ncbi:hypothetical protein MNV84_07354 [Leishmania braziliensis]|nr:hypothetical protein MNV84_07354 [Leishmania braziliensis]